MTRITLDLDTGRLSSWLIRLSIAVLALGFLREALMVLLGSETILKDLRQIALDTEHCLGSFYSSVLMLIAAVAMIAVAQSGIETKRRTHWYVLAAVFALMSLDESVSFHEVLIEPLRGVFAFSSFLHFAWVVPGALFVLAFGLTYIPFVFSLDGALRNRVIVAGGMYVTGALGLEAVGGHFHSIGGFEHPAYIVAFLVEETLEIAGLTLFATALLNHLSRLYATAPRRELSGSGWAASERDMAAAAPDRN